MGKSPESQRLLGILLADRNELLFRTNSFHQIAFFLARFRNPSHHKGVDQLFFRHGLEVFQSCGRRLEFHIGKTAVALRSSFWRESVGISLLPHIISRRFVADLIFFCCFISCEFAVVNPTAYVQPLFFRVLHVATSCRIRELNCPPLVILCTEYYKRCLIYTPFVSSFSLPLHDLSVALRKMPFNHRYGAATLKSSPFHCVPYQRSLSQWEM